MGASHFFIMPTFPDPSDTEDPASYVEALMAAYGPDNISEASFLAMVADGIAFAEASGALNIADFQEQAAEMAGGVGIDEDKVKTVSDDVINKVKQIIIPFIGGEIFRWFDRDGGGGVSKDEMMAIVSLAQGGDPMEICKDFVWNVLDKNGDGELSNEEISSFLAQIFQIGAKTAHCVIDTFATAFRGDVTQVIVQQAFNALDGDGDGFIDEDELAMVKGGLEQMSAQLKEVCDEGEAEPPLMLLLEDAKACKAWLATEAKDGADMDKFMAFNMTLMQGRIDTCMKLLESEEVTDVVPPAIMTKIMEFVPAVVEALKAVTKEKIGAISQAAFTLMDANKDGKLDEEEILALGGLFDPDRDVDLKFSSLLAMIDADGDKKVSPDELTEFAGKLFDLIVCVAQTGVDIYAAIATVVAANGIKFAMGKIAGGDRISKDKYAELMAQVEEDGPEVLMGPLMEE